VRLRYDLGTGGGRDVPLMTRPNLSNRATLSALARRKPPGLSRRRGGAPVGS
jgi:hypothetical protein